MLDKNTCTFKIPTIPPSYNRSFQINFNFHTTELSREAKEFKVKVKQFMPLWLPPSNSMFDVDIAIHNCWFFKNGNLQKKDISNLDKLLIDAIFEKIGQGDEQVLNLSLHKVRDVESYCEVTIKVVESIEQFKLKSRESSPKPTQSCCLGQGNNA